MNFFGGKGQFPIRKESKGGELEKLPLIQEAQKLDSFLQAHPTKVGDKEVANIQSFVAALRAGTKMQEREIVNTLSIEGFRKLFSSDGITFLKKNY